MVSRKTMLVVYAVYVVVAVIVGVAVSMTATPTASPPASGLPNSTCTNSSITLACGTHGVCMLDGGVGAFCLCATGFVWGGPGTPAVWNGACNYPLVSNVNAFLASFLGGGYGADWFLLARGGGGNGGYIAGGVFKIVTLGGLGCWWLIDWIRVLTNTFPDGYGYPLRDEMNTGRAGTLPTPPPMP